MSSNQVDLEAMKMIFKDQRTHLAIGKILRLSVASDRSFLKCLVSILPEGREVVCRMTWAMTGPNSGIVEFPEKDDLVLVGFADGNNDYAFIISRMSSTVDKLPLKAIDGHLVLKAKAGKQSWLTSNLKILLSKGDTVPTENLVLGQQLKTLLSYVLDQLADQADKLKQLSTDISTHNHIGNLGYPVSAPLNAAAFTAAATQFDTKKSNFDAKKSSPVDDQAILSDLAFTEKGT